jgi:hypothetical protein
MEGLNAQQLFRDRKLGADLPSIESPVGPETARSSSRAEHDLIQKRSYAASQPSSKKFTVRTTCALCGNAMAGALLALKVSRINLVS